MVDIDYYAEDFRIIENNQKQVKIEFGSGTGDYLTVSFLSKEVADKLGLYLIFNAKHPIELNRASSLENILERIKLIFGVN